MKNTWKLVLGTLATTTLLGGLVVAQSPENDGVVVLGQSPNYETALFPEESPGNHEGAVQLGSGPAVPNSGIMPTSTTNAQYPPAETVVPQGVIVPGPYTTAHYADYPAGNDIGYAVTNDPHDVLFRVGRRSGQIYGIDDGFTSFQGFFSEETYEDLAIWYFNPRLAITDQGRGVMNLGVGHRAYNPDLNRVFSVSAWWDYDTGHQGSYNQLGLSFAMIGQNFTFRANGNWVLDKDEVNTGVIPIGNPRLENGMIVQDQLQLVEQAYHQADFEVSRPVYGLGRYGFEYGLGAYALFGSDADDAVGVSARIESQVTEDLWVNAIYTNDSEFDSNVSFNFELTVPNAPPSRWFRRPKVRDQLRSSDRRYYRVATTEIARMSTATMTQNGAPLRLAIIDPNVQPEDPITGVALGGAGTLDDPYRSTLDYMNVPVPERSQFGIVFVRRRSDLTDDNLDTTVTLLDNQAFLGEGVPHMLGIGGGIIELPGAMDGPTPLLSNRLASGMDVITLANNNQVAGFSIDATGTASGIVGVDINGFNINRVSMGNFGVAPTGGVINGIDITSRTGAGGGIGLITDNMITGNGLGSTIGINVDHRDGVLGLLVANNDVSGFQGEDRNQNGVLDLTEDLNMNGILDHGEDTDANGVLNGTEDLNGNGVLDRGFGIRIAASNGSTILADDPMASPDLGLQPLGILENMVSDSGSGISHLASDGSTIITNVEENTVTGSTDLEGAGFEFIADDSLIAINTYLQNSSTGGTGNGGIFQTLNGGVIDVVNPVVDPLSGTPLPSFTGNTFNGNALDGLFVQANSGSITFDQLNSSLFNNNGDDGIQFETLAGGTVVVTNPLQGNTISGNGDNGIEVIAGGGGIFLDFGNPDAPNPNTITNNGVGIVGASPGGNGIQIGTAGGTFLGSLIGVTSSGNAGDGVSIVLDGGTIELAGIARSVFTNNGRHGLSIINDNGGTFITPFVGSQDAELLLSDVFLDLDNDPTTAPVLASNDFSNNGEAGLFVGGANDVLAGTTSLTYLGSVTRNSFDRTTSGTDGIHIDARDMNLIAELTQNTFVGRLPGTSGPTDPGAGRGIGGEIGGSSITPDRGGLELAIGTVVPADANLFLNNGDAHVGLVMSGNTVNVVEIDNATFDGAFDDPTTSEYQGEGVHFILRDTATLTGFARRSSFSNNASDGIEIEIQGNNDAGNFATSPAAALNNYQITDSEFVGNGDNGIAIDRTERGQYNDLLIARNDIRENGENGIFISSQHANYLALPNMRPDTLQIIDNLITNNDEDGIQFVVGADADIATRIQGNDISMNGLDVNGNPSGSGVGNGIEFSERNQSAKDSRSVTGIILANSITDNFDDGIDLSAFIGNLGVETVLGTPGMEVVNPVTGLPYVVGPPPAMTTFPSLGLVRSWGLVIGDITLNPVGLIDDNLNLITRNAADGIDVTGGGVVTIGNNIITRNGTLDAQGRVRHAGVNIDGSELQAGQSVGFNGQFPTPDDDINPDINAWREAYVFSNLISLNVGDGIELMSEPSIDFLLSAISPLATETQLTIVNNEITLNEGRGIDMLQRMGDSDGLDRDNDDPDGVTQVFNLNGGFNTDVTIIGNHIKGNQQEGIYLVQTIDNGQNQRDPASVTFDANGESLRAMAPVGDMGDRPRFRLDVHDNEVIGNGEGIVDFPSSGLILRVGTSGGSGPAINFGTGAFFVPRLANFFATSGVNPEDVDGDGVLDNDLDGDGYLDAETVTGAGVSTSITGNLFEGNYGDDVLFQSFTDTVDVPATTGTWNDMEFTPMGFRPDPLSRLDVIFSSNLFNSIEANNRDTSIGTSPGNAGATGEGAFYANDDPFKSRVFTNMTDPPGPYADEGRLRNATRFASRWNTGDMLPPNISPDIVLGLGGTMAYPGMGNSALRVRGTGNVFTDGHLLGPVTLDQIFIFDDPALGGDPDLIDTFGEANGVFANNYTGEEPWGWDVLEFTIVPFNN